MDRSSAIHGSLLVGAVALSRFKFRSHYLYDIDSVNFALALDHFNPEAHQPHPPGYFLYVVVGRLFYRLLGDANTALVAFSIAASCAAAVMIYLLTQDWFGRRAAVSAGLLFVVSPLSWFHGTVALTYIVEVFLSALVGYLCWQTYAGRPGFVWASAAALGVAAGFRQSSILFLGPLWLLSLRRASLRQTAQGMSVLAATALVWFVPMVAISGGPAAYFGALIRLWTGVPARETVISSSLGSSLVLSLARLWVIAGIAVLCFGAACLLVFLGRGERAAREKKVFTWVWLGPGLLFFGFVFLKFVNSGYLLVLSPPLFAWLGVKAAAWFDRTALPGAARAAACVLAGVLNTALFLYGPFYCSHRSVKEFELDLEAALRGLRQVAKPEDSIIVGFDSHFLGYRHASYYLPDYWTVQYPEVPFAEGKRVFAVHRRNTRLLSHLPEGPFQAFVFFPLPPGEETAKHLAKVLERFPGGTLRSQVIEGHKYFFGPAADLRLLFPTVARPH
jgi:hypothetical protein